MARRYSFEFSGVTVAAPQDLFQIIGAAGKTVKIISVSLADIDTTLPTNQQLQLRARFLPATVTNGSGGSAPTGQPFDPGDAAASVTCKANSTTKATTSGTASILLADGCNIYAGYAYPFASPPVIGPSESFVFELLSTPSGTCTMSGTCIVEETGG
jgi:hypothetical protein